MLLVISSGVAEFLRGANITGKGKRTKGNNHQNKKRSHNSTCSSVHRKTMSSPPESQKEQAAKEDNSADVEQAEEQALPSDEKPNEKKSLMAGCMCSRKAQMIGLCVLILVGVVVAAVLSSRAPLVSAPPVSSDNDDDVGIDSPVVGSTLNAQWGKFRCKADSECAPDEFCEYDIGCLPIKDDVCEEDGCGSNVSPDGNECGWGDAKNQMDYLFVRQKNKPPGCTYCHNSWYSKKYCVWKKAIGDECKHNYECMTEYCSWSSPKHCTTRW